MKRIKGSLVRGTWPVFVGAMALAGCVAEVDGEGDAAEILLDEQEANDQRAELEATLEQEAGFGVDAVSEMDITPEEVLEDVILSEQLAALEGEESVEEAEPEMDPNDAAREESRARFRGVSNLELAKRRGRLEYHIRYVRHTAGEKNTYRAQLERVRTEQGYRVAEGRWPMRPYGNRKYRHHLASQLQNGIRDMNRILNWANDYRGAYYTEGQKGYVILAAFIALGYHKELSDRPAKSIYPVQMLTAGAKRKLARVPSNRELGRSIAAQRGWTGGQWSCLEQLFTHESNWDHRATNPSSGACGIPQALPCSKMGSHGSDYRSNPSTQIRWGLDYIAGRYGNPCNAWSAWRSRSPHWY
ncbi:MAG: hypothetical protein KC416_12090 [Myxococcales bacterium]|nr:hypothetical protein [Myxococcales bacterium]